MLYLATASGPKVRDAMTAGQLGQLRQPNAGNRVVDGVVWAADNGCFSDATPFDPDRWLDWLDRQPRTDCLFAVVPDVVGDHGATVERWETFAHLVRELGFRPAFVLQDGCTPDEIPDDTDCVFVGGSTAWKLGGDAVACMRAAKARGCWVHVGRVNSLRRLRWCADLGVVDSVDGTYLAFGPDTNLPRLLSWLEPAQPGLWGVA